MIKTIKTVDINTLITKEHFIFAQNEDGEGLCMPVQNPFFALLKERYNGLVLSNISTKDTNLQIALSTDKPSIALFEQKGDKSRQFHYEFSERYLTIEGRRASKEHFSHLSQVLHKLSKQLTTKDILLYLADPKLSESQTTAHESHFFKTAKISFWTTLKAIKALPESISTTLHNKLRTLSDAFKDFFKVGKKATSNTESKEELDELRETAFDLLDNNDRVCISDSRLKNKNLNTVHTLDITQETLRYIERSKLSKTVFKFDMAAMSLTINDELAKGAAIEKLFDKLTQMGADLESGRAEMFVKKDD